MATQTTPLRTAAISFSSSGDNTVVAQFSNPTPSSGVPIYIYGLYFTVDGATAITYKAGTTALSGAINLTANGSSDTKAISAKPYFVVPPVGGDFIINSSNAVNVKGEVYYTYGA